MEEVFTPNNANELDYEIIDANRDQGHSVTSDDNQYSNTGVEDLLDDEDNYVQDTEMPPDFGVDNDYEDVIIESAKRRKMLNTHFNGSNVTNAAIKSAVHGVIYPQYRVGSVNEYLFFRVMNARGRTYRDENGDLQTVPPQKCFYTSPEEYERYSKCKISLDVKQRWHRRRNQILAQRVKS
jgi:hypothetical protein